ncbi:hypothetical protein BFJ68_g18541 [Fusarium oxysporum]|uniref:Uncharacterized protein n=1 Tax=Fusarium oxysporum TaxID=5507 RepID=A0A420MHZ9_FUSOX|nr:hypothetical protein BFJ68_g18541 [Fusarium oxysporum]RKK67937.1 hypothetical protein BFJ71_g17814 [Fusarium oxysporum]
MMLVFLAPLITAAHLHLSSFFLVLAATSIARRTAPIYALLLSSSPAPEIDIEQNKSSPGDESGGVGNDTDSGPLTPLFCTSVGGIRAMSANYCLGFVWAAMATAP